MATSQELSAFIAWAEESEILWDKAAIEIKEGKHGLGVFARKSLHAGSEGKRERIGRTALFLALNRKLIVSLVCSHIYSYPGAKGYCALG